MKLFEEAQQKGHEGRADLVEFGQEILGWCAGAQETPLQARANLSLRSLEGAC